MGKQFLKILGLIIIFISSLCIFNISTNQVNESQTAEMAEASLPVVYFVENGIDINELHGYVRPMDLTAMRDTITPIGNTRRIAFRMNTYGADIDRVTCEIYTIDGSELVATEARVDYVMNGDQAEASLYISNDVRDKTEYQMVLTVNHDGKQTYYYTRIIQGLEWNVPECLAFAEEFHGKTFEEGQNAYFRAYQDSEGSNAGDYFHITLDSDAPLLSWGALDARQITEERISIKEINAYYTVIGMNYRMEASYGEGEAQQYEVEEYFRLRYTEEHVYVLNYERSAQKVFSPTEDFVTENGELLLGVRDPEVETKSNETGSIVAFVQNGELWSFDAQKGTVSEVFRFATDDPEDLRSSFSQHDIRIARVDEVGNIDFWVYGYMNRGNHEGETGILLYHYDSLMHTIREELYLPSDQSYMFLSSGDAKLLALDQIGHMYLIRNGSLCEIDIETKETTILAENLEDGSYLLADDSRFLTWRDKDESNLLHVMDITADRIYDIQTADSTTVVPLMFLGTDLIYGLRADIGSELLSSDSRLCKEITIVDVSGEKPKAVKTYQKSGYLLGNFTTDSTNLNFDLFWKKGSGYVKAGSDILMNGDADASRQVKVCTYKADGYLKLVRLEMGQNAAVDKLQLLTSAEIATEVEPEVTLPETEEPSAYYVYAWGKLLLATPSYAEAIALADDERGLVTDRQLNVLWTRARAVAGRVYHCDKQPERTQVNTMLAALEVMLEREGTYAQRTGGATKAEKLKSILEERLPDHTVYELYGLSGENLLYFISIGSPVLCMTGEKTAVLICSYDTSKIYYYDFEAGELKAAKYTAFDKLMAEGGYHALTYVNYGKK